MASVANGKGWKYMYDSMKCNSASRLVQIMIVHFNQEDNLWCVAPCYHTLPSIPTLPHHLGVSWIQSTSPDLLYESISQTIEIKAYKILYPDIFKPIIGIFGRNFAVWLALTLKEGQKR